MVRSVSIGYTAGMTKDSGLRIRIERDLRDKFLERCREEDRPAAQIIREFMRKYIGDGAPANDQRAKAPKKRKGRKP